ncbi:semaphorin-7A-like [Pristis pectinata]|uniref:semaphorin-7A-like n=1 Tax=Pristis pectinata TaxID=685728 RepID=UPI00223E8638|nr:semaphorin-7A-like [Pristis pectinata]
MVTLLPVLFALLSPVAGHSSPRLKLDLSGEIKNRFVFNQTEEFATTLRDGSTVYVGGNGALYQINFDVSPTLETINVPGVSKECQGNNAGPCGNYIMILHKFNGTHFLLCGTNWMSPQCWLLFNKKLNEFINGNKLVLGPRVCPKTPQQGFASLVVEERLYSTASDGDKMHLTGYRKGDDPTRLKSEEKWMKDPRFVGMSPVDDLIYMFFREKNAHEHPDIDPWISRIGRVCKNDQGGSRQRLLTKWTTFLKARLLCSNPADNVHFNRIEDAFIYKFPHDSEARVYGVFSSNWNGTAVCMYSMKEINDVFGRSAFKDFKGSIPTNPRPGTCVNNTKVLPDQVLAVVEDYPEMETWIHPIGRNPLVISYENRFKKIVVDSVVGPSGDVSRVLYLAMGDGKIQKVLETNHSAFIIAELKLLKEPASILSMSLDSEKKFLYVTSAKELVQFPLVQCEKYDGNCGECVQARDPYCGWDSRIKKCVPVTPDSKNVFQDLEKGDSCVHGQVEYLHSSRREIPPDWPVLPLPLKEHIPVYLSCPKKSYHAEYSWRFNGHKQLPCSTNDDNCLLFLSGLSESDIGPYECISNERGVERRHAAYLIQDNGGSSIYLSHVALFSVLTALICQVLQ